MVLGSASPNGPNDASELVSKSHGGFVVATSLLEVEYPGAKSIGLSVFGSGPQNSTCAVSEEGPEVDVALFADTSEPSGGSGGTFSRSEAQEASEMSTRAEALDVSDESDESSGGQDTETGDGEQSLDGGVLFSKDAQVLLSTLHERLEAYDLITGLVQGIP